MHRWIGFALLLCLPFPACAQTATPIRTLKDAFLEALKNSETVAMTEASIREAEALYRRALGISGPEVFFRNQTSWQNAFVPNGQSTRGLSDGMFRLSQQSLTGYRELANLRGAKATARQRGEDRLRAEQLLLFDVAGAFFGLLQARETAAATRELIASAAKRLAELTERVRVGRARQVDAVGQAFQTEALRSQLEESERQVGARTALLSFLTRSTSIQAEAGPAGPGEDTRPLESFLARVDSRPDVRSAMEAREASLFGIDAAVGDRFPDLGYQANYYAYRPATRSASKWDAQITASIPLWSWGARQAALDAAKAGYERSRLNFQGIRRAAEREILDAHRDAASARRQLAIQTKALELAKKDYELQRADEKRGLVTSLEVIESINRLNQAQLSHASALLQARLAALNLDLTAGARPEETEALK